MTGMMYAWAGKRYVLAHSSPVRAVLTSRGDVYVSGSAYKIVKDRAYHHGTMLISTKLDTLGELLRSNKVRHPALFPGTSRSLIEGQ